MVMGKFRKPLVDIQNCGLPIILKVMGERWSFMILLAGKRPGRSRSRCTQNEYRN